MRRSMWNGIGIVAALGLATTIAVVAVSRSERGPANPRGTPTAGAAPTPTRSGPLGAPGSLEGTGPFLVYEVGGAVSAYDVASGATVPIGRIDGQPGDEPSRQPGHGSVVAFGTDTGSVWRVRRSGLTRAATIRLAEGQFLTGRAVSSDGERLALALEPGETQIAIVELDRGSEKLYPRRPRSGDYPPEPLLPVGWSLGGTVVYEIPLCRCGGGSRGLWTLDLSTGRSTIVTAARDLDLYRFAMSPEGQAILFGAATPRRCRSSEAGRCQGPPYSLRRFAAGRTSLETLRRETDATFGDVVMSADGAHAVVRRFPAKGGASRLEVIDAGSGDRRAASYVTGAPAGLVPAAMLAGGAVVASAEDAGGSSAYPVGTIVLLAPGGRKVVASPAGADVPVFLGWLT